MLGNSLIEIKRTFRNKRFFIFTIIMPIVLYIIFSSVFSIGKSGESNVSINFYFLEIVAGMLGNNIFTLATTITKEKKFYLDIFRVSPHTIIYWIMDKIIVQAILNFIIVLSIGVIGNFFLNLPIKLWIIEATIIIFIFCIIFSFVGVLLGIYLEEGSVQSIANPIYTLIIIFMLPSEITKYLPKLYMDISKFLPGYYIWNLIDNLKNNISIFNTNLLILVSFLVVIVIVSYMLLILRLRKEIKR